MAVSRSLTHAGLIRLAVIVFAVIATAVGLGNVAQAQAKICLIDMAKVFKAHPGFNQQMQDLKVEADAFQVKLQQAQQALAKMNEDLRLLDANGDEFRQKESEIAQTSANLEIERRNQVRDLMIREAKIHFDTYASITGMIGRYCSENSVPLVIRFVSEPMRLEDPASIEQGFNNSVVYYAPGQDITDAIIQRIAQAPAGQLK